MKNVPKRWKTNVEYYRLKIGKVCLKEQKLSEIELFISVSFLLICLEKKKLILLIKSVTLKIYQGDAFFI